MVDCRLGANRLDCYQMIEISSTKGTKNLIEPLGPADYSEPLCFTASRNILVSGNISLKLFMAPLEIIELQLNSCNSNSYNSKDHLNRTNSSVPSEFTSKPLQENSFNSNSHNSKNYLNRTNFWVP